MKNDIEAKLSFLQNGDVIDLVKGNGPWQWLIFLVGFFCGIPLVFHNFSMSFFAPNLDHWCARPYGMNISVQEWKELLPPDDKKCSRYSLADISYLQLNGNYSELESIPCTSWEYDESVYDSTVLSKFDLVCDNEWLVSMSKSIFTAGYLVSVMTFGYISDRFGRKPVIVSCNVIALISAITCAFSTSFVMFAVLRFFIAVGLAGAFNTMFVLLMEVVGSRYRETYGISINFGWCLGYVSLPLIAWLIRDWFWIQLILVVPSVLLLFSWWLLPESPKWLLSQGNVEEAKHILVKAAKLNGASTTNLDAKLKEFMLNKSKGSESSDSERGNFFLLFKTPGMRQKTLILFYLWCIIAFMYYGLSYNTNELVGDPFINFAVYGAIEFPVNLICIFVVKSFGRKNPTSGSLIIAAFACLLMYPLPPDPWWLSTIVSMTGKFGISCAFSIIYIYTAEIFPTVVRNVGMGSASVCARMGNIIAPFVRELGKVTHPVVPQIVFGVLSGIGSILILLLPETKNCRVPDTFIEAVQATRKKSTFQKRNDIKLNEIELQES